MKMSTNKCALGSSLFNKQPACTLFVLILSLDLCMQVHTSILPNKDYWLSREDLINEEKQQELGSDIQLTPDEHKANEILMRHKLSELDLAYQDPGTYLPSHHFFDTKHLIKQNIMYEILQQMPKGGLLHTHDTATTSWEFLYEQTWREKLYLCQEVSQPERLRFFAVPDATCDWKLLAKLRGQGDDFEEQFKGMLTLVRPTYNEEFSDINKVWSTFQDIFILVTDMLTYRPVFEAQYYNTLKELYHDNITYLEFRGTLPPVYELDGTIYSPKEVVALYVNLTETFRQNHPHFIGAKMIYAPLRLVNDDTVEEYLQIAKEIKGEFPDFVAGFDLVGQEDLGRPLIDYVDMLQSFEMDYFFHAGETNWNQGLTDQNIIDAVLLGTKRLGHAYALIKHPSLMQLVKERQIALEVSPISNQVLALVRDLRNHPGAIYMAHNMPMVITNDDPTYWGAQGVSYDWYMAFMGMSSRTADLKLLKQLAHNSLKFSALDEAAKTVAFEKWETQWLQFIQTLINSY